MQSDKAGDHSLHLGGMMVGGHGWSLIGANQKKRCWLALEEGEGEKMVPEVANGDLIGRQLEAGVPGSLAAKHRGSKRDLWDHWV